MTKYLDPFGVYAIDEDDIDPDYDGPSDEEQWAYNERILTTEVDARHEHDETL